MLEVRERRIGVISRGTEGTVPPLFGVRGTVRPLFTRCHSCGTTDTVAITAVPRFSTQICGIRKGEESAREGKGADREGDICYPHFLAQTDANGTAFACVP